MPDQIIEVHYETTAEDYRRVLFWYQWKRLVIVAIAYILAVGLILSVLSYGAGGPTNLTEGRAPTMAFIFLLMLPLLMGISGFYGIWRQAGKTAKLTEPATATFRDAGINIVTPSSKSETVWDRFAKVYETKSDLIFFPFENVFYIIPKRCFSDKRELELVKYILRAGLGIRAKLKG